VPSYAERLTPPVGIYVLAWALAGALGFSFLVALGPAAGAVALLVPGVAATVLLSRSTAVVEVGDGHLRAGPARIPVDALGPVEALDAEQARQVRGPASDPAAFHLIRGWIPAGVRAAVVDPEDPTPYWFVASRRPAQLAAAVEAARKGRG
jgi:hypothetical protein